MARGDRFQQPPAWSDRPASGRGVERGMLPVMRSHAA